MANMEFGTGKSVLILTIVAACFAILWPKIFYPMLVGTPVPKRPVDVSGGCCDVIFETDVNAIRVLSEMCSRVNGIPAGVTITPAGVAACRATVLQQCDIDIATFLNEQARLGRSYRQILDELRSFNTSVCLRRNFGVSPGSLGAPRRMRTWGATTSRHLRQERPPHLRPEVLHPALRERGRAIPASHTIPKVEKDPGIKPPIPGMRPPMGGAGHVVAAPKTAGGTMSIVMPLYTIGIVIFFMYTIMKVFVRKSNGDDSMRGFEPDPEFRRVVFAEECNDSKLPPKQAIREPVLPTLIKAPSTDTTRLGWKERDTRDDEIHQLRKRLEETERAMERIVAQMGKVPQVAAATLKKKVEETKPGKESTVIEPEVEEEKVEQVFIENKELIEKEIIKEKVAKEEKETKDLGEGPRVRIVGVETRARAEGGIEWRPPPSPTFGLPHSRPVTPLPPEPEPEPHNIFLEGNFPSHSQLLVEDAATELIDEAQNASVILSGKMTLSLIMDAPTHPVPNSDTDPESTLLDVQSVVIDDGSIDGEVEDEGEVIEEGTHFTTANTAANPSNANAVNTASANNDADADDTAADLSAQDFLDDQEDLQEEYDAIWGAIDMEDDGSANNKDLGQQHQR